MQDTQEMCMFLISISIQFAFIIQFPFTIHIWIQIF